MLAVLAPGAGSAQGDAALDTRITESARAAQSLQGPLDGSWLLTTADGRALYALELVDPVAGGRLEGVWRDLRRAAPPGDTGVIERLERAPRRLIVSFGAPPITFVLKARAGGWSGVAKQGASAFVVDLRRK
jgi:hypothetical protein